MSAGQKRQAPAGTQIDLEVEALRANDEVQRPTLEEVIEIGIDKLNGEWIEERIHPDGRRERRIRRLRGQKTRIRVHVFWIGILLVLALTIVFKPELLNSVADAIATIRARAG